MNRQSPQQAFGNDGRKKKNLQTDLLYKKMSDLEKNK